MNPGSVKFHVEFEVVNEYRRIGLNWVEIADKLETTTKTLLKWRKNNEYQVNIKMLMKFYRIALISVLLHYSLIVT